MRDMTYFHAGQFERSHKHFEIVYSFSSKWLGTVLKEIIVAMEKGQNKIFVDFNGEYG